MTYEAEAVSMVMVVACLDSLLGVMLMIAVAQTGPYVWGVSISGEELTMLQGIADAKQKEVKGVLAEIIAGGLSIMVDLTGDVFGDNKKH